MTGSGHDHLHATRLEIDPSAFVAPGAVLVGRVTLGADSSVWYQCVLRGDLEPISVGARTNVQDGVVIHVDRGFPTVIGDDVTIGHRAVVHGAVVESGSLIGMGAVVLSGARVGRGSLIAAGAVVREGFVLPPGSLVAGVPARVLREVDDETRRRIAAGVEEYVNSAARYRDGMLGGGPHGGR
jgi:carbonic anhydrase/acetyltransferase-like protein (isoleucine patch superfamily)